MLQNCLRLVLLDRLWHHVKDIVHNRGAKLQVIVRLDTLLGDSLSYALRVTSLELTSQKVPKPTLKKRHNPTHKEEPDSPARSPEADSGALSNGTSVEAIIDKMLQVFCHPNLPHELVFVAVHARESADVCKDILQCICKLESINVAEAVLHVSINNKLCQAKDFATKVESIAEARLLALFCGQSPIKSTVSISRCWELGNTDLTGFKFML